MSYHPFSDLSHSPFAPLASPLEKPAVNPPSAAISHSKDVKNSTSTPWYRTTKGLAIIIAGSFVVVGVIVGVAVGVTQSKNNRSEDSVPVSGQVGVTVAAPTATTTATTTTAIMTTTATTATVAPITKPPSTCTLPLLLCIDETPRRLQINRMYGKDRSI